MFVVSEKRELQKGVDMELCDKHVEALKDGEHFRCSLYETSDTVHVVIFEDNLKMRKAIRAFFNNKRDGWRFSKDTLGLAVGKCISGKFVGLVFLCEEYANVMTLAHEATHIVSFYFEDKIKKYSLANIRTNENFAKKVGYLTMEMTAFVRMFKQRKGF